MSEGFIIISSCNLSICLRGCYTKNPLKDYWNIMSLLGTLWAPRINFKQCDHFFFIVATVWECRNSCGVCPALIINYYLPSLGSSSEVMTRVSSMVLVVLVVGVVLVWLLALLLYSQHIGRLRSSFKAQTLFTSGLRWSGLRYPFRQSNLNVHYMHYRFTSTLFNFIH